MLTPWPTDQPPLRRLPAAEIADTGKPPMARTSTSSARRGQLQDLHRHVKNVPTESFEMARPTARPRRATRAQARGRDRRDQPVEPALLLMTWKVGPALACGNTVVVKPSEETPATATLLGEVMNAVGVPPASTTWCTASARIRPASS
jgi:aminomuconate-semialdehyde/2-hydroxymuconate-6-semialdehyde dehydrogenase